jgi:Domain of unknown function (DUF1906)
MKILKATVLALFLMLGTSFCSSQQSYLGFDRNDYPGDVNLPSLRKQFRYTSYWLNDPPGEHQNSWTGKRSLLKQQGFGFIVLFNGRFDSDLKTKDPVKLGTIDGRAAVAAAAKEGFPNNVLIFLDQEEGGRLLPEQIAYIFAWADTVQSAGARAGIYCSGIDVPDGQNTISTARDIVAQEKARITAARKDGTSSRYHSNVALWIVNDECPPSPGCTSTRKLPAEGFASPEVVAWQYVRSPLTQFGAACKKTYAADGSCYASGLPHSAATFLDMDIATSADPSEAPNAHLH